MLWFSSLGGVVFVRCIHCGATQAQRAGRGDLVCNQRGCRKRFTRKEGEAYLRGRGGVKRPKRPL